MLYVASKHAARALSEGFRHELTKKKLRIKVSVSIGTEIILFKLGSIYNNVFKIKTLNLNFRNYDFRKAVIIRIKIISKNIFEIINKINNEL